MPPLCKARQSKPCFESDCTKHSFALHTQWHRIVTVQDSPSFSSALAVPASLATSATSLMAHQAGWQAALIRRSNVAVAESHPGTQTEPVHSIMCCSSKTGSLARSPQCGGGGICRVAAGCCIWAGAAAAALLPVCRPAEQQVQRHRHEVLAVWSNNIRSHSVLLSSFHARRRRSGAE
jgi:hypothetical protein